MSEGTTAWASIRLKANATIVPANAHSDRIIGTVAAQSTAVMNRGSIASPQCRMCSITVLAAVKSVTTRGHASHSKAIVFLFTCQRFRRYFFEGQGYS